MNSEDETLRDRARRLRADPTAEERKLWQHLKAKRLGGFRFRRQHPIGPYFADFCCITRQVIVELDGSQHADEDAERKDVLRTAFLNERGYRVMRFWNDQVIGEIENVLEAIRLALMDPESRT
jgi:very-short-patch-repair endonuclease